jgi:hypothetical protein
MLRGTLENAQRFRFDPWSKHRVQAGSCHDVGFCAEDLTDLVLHIDQFDETEARVIGIEEQIDIAIRPGFSAGDRAEQVEPSDTGSVEFGFVGTKPRDDIVSIHGYLRMRIMPELGRHSQRHR